MYYSVSFDDITPARYTVPSDSGVCLDKDRDYLLLSDSEIDVCRGLSDFQGL